MIKKIINIAKEASKIIMKYYSKDLRVSTKGKDPYNFVTKADIKSDNYIRQRLQEEFPGDYMLSEENKNIPPEYSGRVWIIDPLDGTKDFVNKGSGFSVMIGLCDNGKPILGVVYAPAKDLLYYAEKGKGAYMEKDGVLSQIHVNDITRLNQARMITRIAHGEARPLDKMINNFKVKEIIPESSIGLKLGMIASGDAEFHISSHFLILNKTSKWDTCAPQIILEEAGGIITDFKGNGLDYKQKSLLWENSFVASNSLAMHKEIIKGIKDYMKKFPFSDIKEI